MRRAGGDARAVRVSAIVSSVRLRGQGVVKGADHAASLLSEAVGGAHQVGGEDDGRDAGVGDAHIGEPVDAEVGVDDAALVEGEHGTGGGGVELCADLAGEPGLPFLVGLDGRPGRGFARHAAC